MKRKRFIAGRFIIILFVLLWLCGCVSGELSAAPPETTSTPKPTAKKGTDAKPELSGEPDGPGWGGSKGDAPEDPPKEEPPKPEEPPKEEPPEPEEPPEKEPEEPDRPKVGASPKIVDVQKNWRIIGEGTKSFETPGIPGQNKMIVNMDVSKRGGETPAGTYTGSFSLWYYEMTPEMMKKYGATGDSHNEYQTGSFTVEVIPWTHNEEWPYQAARVVKSITITSITDITIQGQRQQVTDTPTVKLGYSVVINPKTGIVEVVMTLGMPESFIFSDFKLESSSM